MLVLGERICDLDAGFELAHESTTFWKTMKE